MELEHLLNFVLIISANEAANVIAENISPTGRINEFVDLMNEKASELGLRIHILQIPMGLMLMSIIHLHVIL